jgi:hypothetical protein
MHVGAVVIGAGHAVDGTRHLAIDEDDALVARPHLRQVALRDDRLLEQLPEHFEERREVLVALMGLEDAGPAIAVERLEDDVAMLAAEGVQFRPSRVIRVGGMRLP